MNGFQGKSQRISEDHMSSSPGEYEKQKVKSGKKENTFILKSYFFQSN